MTTHLPIPAPTTPTPRPALSTPPAAGGAGLRETGAGGQAGPATTARPAEGGRSGREARFASRALPGGGVAPVAGGVAPGEPRLAEAAGRGGAPRPGAVGVEGAGTAVLGASGVGTPVLGACPGQVETLDAYLRAGGYGPGPGPGELLDRVEAAGLRGHGGAGFPTAVKLRAVRDAGRTPVVIANGEEGEPGSVKDRWLLRARPHLVLDGLARAAALTGADRAYVYLSDEPAEQSVRAALAERALGLPVEVVRVAPAYVAGEESAVVRRIDGGPALPTAKPPRVFERGVGGAPTLVANVETLARLALLAIGARDDSDGSDCSGGSAAARVGGASTVLLTVSGGGEGAARLVERRYGTTLRGLAAEHGTPAPAAVLMGGLFGGLLPPSALDLPLDRARLAEAGTGLGCGAIRFLAPDECPVSVAADAVDHLAVESSRQCGVCVSGTRALRDTLVALAEGRCDEEGLTNLARWAQGLPGRGACGLLDAAARLAGSLLAGFPQLVAEHRDRPCPTCAATPPDAGRRLRVAVPVPVPSVGPASTALPGATPRPTPTVVG